MTDFYVRWGDDVQPYILQLASEHIETLRICCNDVARTIVESRAGERVVICVTARVKPGMLNGPAFHCFEMFGFNFKLREGETLEPSARKQEFILNFAATPEFAPEDMPPRLHRVGGKPLSARPTRRRRPRAAAPAQARGPRAGTGKRRRIERQAYRLRPCWLWIHARVAAPASSLAAKLYKMYESYQGLWSRFAAAWRRRPCLELPRRTRTFLSFQREVELHAPRARLEPRLIGESLRLPLFTFVSRETSELRDASWFGEPPEEGERISA